MINFELSEEIERDVFSLVTSAGQIKNPESPRGIKPQTFKLWASILQILWCPRTLESSDMTCILHTSRIRNVNSIMYVNRIRKNNGKFDTIHDCIFN